MEGTKVMFLVVLVGLAMVGCATKHVPKFAYTEAEQRVSVPHPDQIQQDTDKITTFWGVINPAFLVEADDLRGVWPALAQVGDGYKEGFVFSLTSLSEEMPWGVVVGEFVFLGSKEEISSSKIVMVNQDGGAWLAGPNSVILDAEKGEYDCERFEKDKEYRNQIFQKGGLALPEINIFWQKFANARGIATAKEFVAVNEIQIGSSEWEKFRKNLLSEMGNGYRMPDGKIRAGFITREELQKEMMKNPRMTGWQRFMEALSIPIFPSPEGMAFGAVSSLVRGGIATSSGNRWNAKTARSECQRRDVADQIVFLYNFYQRKLTEMEIERR